VFFNRNAGLMDVEIEMHCKLPKADTMDHAESLFVLTVMRFCIEMCGVAFD